MVNIVSLYQQLFGRKGPGIGSDIDLAEHGRVGGVSTGQSFKHTSLIDQTSGVAAGITARNQLETFGVCPFLEIARGNVSGITHINKFGRAFSGVQTTATDIWDRADTTPTQQIWSAPTQARIHTIVSTSDEDSETGGTNPQGDGARTLRIFGLTDWDTAETSEDIIMDGTNGVNTSDSYVIIYRMKVLTKGPTNVNVGVITATAQTDDTVTAQINVSEGQTQMAIYGIPSTQTGYMVSYYASTNKQENPANVISVDMRILVNQEPKAELTNFLVKHTQGLYSNGVSYWNHSFVPYFRITGPAIIKMQGISSTADTDVSGGFDIILVDN